MSAGSTRVGTRERWNFQLTLNHAGRELWEHQERLICVKKRGESAEHVTMKVLAYVLLFEPGLAIEASADQHYKPDVVLLDEQGHAVIWADCGTTSVRKLDAISAKNRRTRITIVKAHRRELASFKRSAEKSLRFPERVCWWAFRDHFVHELATRFTGRHRLDVSVAASAGQPPNHVFISIDAETFDSPLVRL